MTNNEARLILCAYVIAHNKDIPQEVMEALGVMEEANEKQIPKAGSGYYHDICPVCGWSLASREGYSTPYCSHCGQMIGGEQG